jgi:hypothetical protein
MDAAEALSVSGSIRHQVVHALSLDRPTDATLEEVAVSSHRRVPLFAAVIALVVGIPALAAPPASPPPIAPRSLADYALSCYCNAAHGTPDKIVKMDNNGEILAACLPGRTAEQLRDEGTRCTDSQIRLLLDWGLLKEEQRVLKTSFLVLDPAATLRLRALARDSARALALAIEGDARELTRELRASGRERNTYTVLFSYVLDNLSWERFYEEKLLEDRPLTLEEPLWTGVLWASYPLRTFSCGTNTTTVKGVTLGVNWSPGARRKMGPLVGGSGAIARMLTEYLDKGRVEDPVIRKLFEPFRLLDSEGRLTAASILQDDSDPIFRTSAAIAKKVSEHELGFLRSDPVRSELASIAGPSRLIVTYHELMWELLDRLEALGIVSKPVAMADPERAQPADVGDLVFVLKQGPAPAKPER